MRRGTDFSHWLPHVNINHAHATHAGKAHVARFQARHPRRATSLRIFTPCLSPVTHRYANSLACLSSLARVS